MSIEVKVPALPESVSEATVVTWHKQPGDSVERDENLVDLETDKVVLEVPAPDDGVIGKLLREEGDTVSADEVIATLEEGDGAASSGGDAAPQPGDAGQQEQPDQPSEEAASSSASKREVDDDLSPAVRRLVAEHDLEPGRIEGSGRGGRITKEDVIRHLDEAPAEQRTSARAESQAAAKSEAPQKSAAKAETSASSAAERKSEAPRQPAAEELGERPERRVPMTRLRQRIAERLVEAQQTAAMLTTFNEVNMQPVMDVRARHKERFQEQHGVKLGVMSFFVKAAVEGLKRHAAVNASIDGKDIIYHGYYDIGIAVSTDRGLMVPVLRDADHASFADIEKTIADFGKRAREGKIGIDELTGGTFTITNGGIFGSLLSTPILNPPQSGILGMHKTQDRAMVESGQVVVRPMMYLAHSYDHRIIDGREAVQFLVTIKEMLEDPARMLLQV